MVVIPSFTPSTCGNGSSQFPAGSKIFEVAGFREKIFYLMAMAERDPDVLLKTIEAINL